MVVLVLMRCDWYFVVFWYGYVLFAVGLMCFGAIGMFSGLMLSLVLLGVVVVYVSSGGLVDGCRLCLCIRAWLCDLWLVVCGYCWLGLVSVRLAICWFCCGFW